MINPPCFVHVGAAFMSLAVLAACVPSEHVETGVASVSDNATHSASRTVPGSAQDEAVESAPAEPQPLPPRPSVPPMPDPKRLLGLDPAVTMGLLGEPTWRRLDGHTQVYSFVSKACRANVYFMRADETAPFLLNHAEFQPPIPDNEGLSEASCLASFFPAGDIPSILLKDVEAKEASLK